MSRFLQSWIALASLLAALSLSGFAETTIVQPVVDRGGACLYCDVVADAFEQASESIDIMLSNAEWEENPLIEPLVAAHRRGVHIRVLLDQSDWAPSITARNRPTLEALIDEGIDARFDDPSVTTHAKLVLVDRETVILGSSNWNRYAFTDHVQANVRVVNAQLADGLTDWFDRHWAGDPPEMIALDRDKPADGPRIVALPDGDGSTVYAACVEVLLADAEASVFAALYRVSYYAGYGDSSANRLVNGLIDAAARGLDVRVLIDDCSFYEESAEANLASAIRLHQRGVPVRFDAPEDTMHAKLLVIDGEHTVLGSTNWNYYALERNNEVGVALLGMPDVAEHFTSAFRGLWDAGRSLGP